MSDMMTKALILSKRQALLLTGVIAFMMFGLAVVLWTGLKIELSRDHLIWALCILYVPLVSLIWFDLTAYRLPDAMTLSLCLAGLIFNFVIDQNAIWIYIVGAGFGYGLIWSVNFVFRLLKGVDGIGLGDAKLLAAGGAWWGVFYIPIITMLASILGIILILSVSLRSKNEKKMSMSAIPFGVPLSVAIWCVAFLELGI